VWAPFAWLVSYVDPRKPVRSTQLLLRVLFTICSV
jgi:hypothetical protein